MDTKATDSFRDRNLSANYSCGLLQLRLESDWSQNNKHSRNNFRRSWFNGFHQGGDRSEAWDRETMFSQLAKRSSQNVAAVFVIKNISDRRSTK